MRPNPNVPEERRCGDCSGWGFIILLRSDEKIDETCRTCKGTGHRKEAK